MDLVLDMLKNYLNLVKLFMDINLPLVSAEKGQINVSQLQILVAMQSWWLGYVKKLNTFHRKRVNYNNTTQISIFKLYLYLK